MELDVRPEVVDLAVEGGPSVTPLLAVMEGEHGRRDAQGEVRDVALRRENKSTGSGQPPADVRGREDEGNMDLERLAEIDPRGLDACPVESAVARSQGDLLARLDDLGRCCWRRERLLARS